MKTITSFVLTALATAPLLASADTPKPAPAASKPEAKPAPAAAKPEPKADAGAAGHVMFKPGDIKWADAPPVLPAGAKIAVLAGDPFKPGYYSLRLKFPANYKIAPH